MIHKPLTCSALALLMLCILTFNVRANEQNDDHDPETLETMIISTPLPQSTDKTALPVTVLSGEQLRLQVGSSLGETLQQEPGITSQSFGPGVGQPVIRGQTGSRVLVLQNGLGSLDASSLSPDHANSTEALWAERIEVLRGPAALLYGSGAIGGVVNVIDNRVPSYIPDQLIEATVEQRYNTVNRGKNTAFKLDGGKGNIAFHIDGFYRDSGNLDIPGLAIDAAAEAETHDEEDVDDDHDEEVQNSSNKLLNSDTESLSGTVGLSWVGEDGFIGISVNHLKNEYGIPPGAHGHGEEEHHDEEEDEDEDEDEDEEEHHDEEEEEENVRIDLRQTRYDLKGELSLPYQFANKVKLRLGYNDYQHIEQENGERGTTYDNRGFVSRVELLQDAWWLFDHGVVGFQTRNNEFSALGEEAFVPKSDIDSFGVFMLEDIHLSDVTLEFGVRVEQQWIKPEGLRERSHTPVSASLSALWYVTDTDSLSLSFSRSQRAPDIQELFANGAHLATSSFELGDSSLNEETSHNIELGIRINRDWMQAELNLFQNWVDDYISQFNTGRFFDDSAGQIADNCPTLDCLPVFQAVQRDAQLRGFEGQVTVPIWNFDSGTLETRLFADFVRAEFSDKTGGDVPRMPPLRFGGQLGWKAPNWGINLRATRAESQNNPGANETATGGYLAFNVNAQYRLDFGASSSVLLFAKGTNLLNDEIRYSTSFLRNFAPQAGRGVELGLRLVF